MGKEAARILIGQEEPLQALPQDVIAPASLVQETGALRPRRPGLGLMEEYNNSIGVCHNQLAKVCPSTCSCGIQPQIPSDFFDLVAADVRRRI